MSYALLFLDFVATIKVCAVGRSCPIGSQNGSHLQVSRWLFNICTIGGAVDSTSPLELGHELTEANIVNRAVPKLQHTLYTHHVRVICPRPPPPHTHLHLTILEQLVVQAPPRALPGEVNYCAAITFPGRGSITVWA